MFLFYFWPFDQNIFLHHSWCSDLCNYKKHDLASLKSDGDKLDVNKSETASTDLSELNDIVPMML